MGGGYLASYFTTGLRSQILGLSLERFSRMRKLRSVFESGSRLLCLQVSHDALAGLLQGVQRRCRTPTTRQLRRTMVFWVILIVKRTNFQHQENQLLTVWAPEKSSVGTPPVRD